MQVTPVQKNSSYLMFATICSFTHFLKKILLYEVKPKYSVFEESELLMMVMYMNHIMRR